MTTVPGPAPSSKPGRHRRPGRDIEWTNLPPDGRDVVPAAPDHLQAPGLAWWDRNWRTPSATQWGEAEFDIATRRAELQDIWHEDGTLGVLPEMRHCETSLGLTAKARKELRWRIVADDGTVVEQAGLTDEVAERRSKTKIRDAQAG